ncbi:hypothetical protein PGB90_007654 [Kerria lacca]
MIGRTPPGSPTKSKKSDQQNSDEESSTSQCNQPTRLAKTLAKDRIRNLSSNSNSPPSSPFYNTTNTNLNNFNNFNMANPSNPIFHKTSEVTRLIRHEFSGNPDELQPFLDDCNLANLYCPLEMISNLLIEIVAHITKAVRSDLQGRSDLQTWEKLREYLKKKYKYQYTCDQLNDQLSCVEQKPFEKCEQYADRIQHLVWKTKEAAITGENIEFITKMTEKLALNRFKNHSLPEISRFLRLKGVTTFDAAVQEAIEEERQNQSHFFKKKFCTKCNINNHTTSECRKEIQNFNTTCTAYNQLDDWILLDTYNISNIGNHIHDLRISVATVESSLMQGQSVNANATEDTFEKMNQLIINLQDLYDSVIQPPFHKKR